MIIFEKLRYKNFLSTGKNFIEIPLNTHKNTLIVGKNGAGKSTILSALCFALFGRAFTNINKPTIVNSVNGKDCVVELEFTIGTNQYKIVRGIKPNIFDVYKNGSLITVDSSLLDYQDNLEKNILKMNFKSFTQIVILGSASFTPFMQLKASDRRSIIEDLLDIQIFSVMNTLSKQKYNSIKEDLDNIEKTKIALNKGLGIIADTIKSYTSIKSLEKIISDNQKKIEKNKKQLDVIKKILLMAV